MTDLISSYSAAGVLPVKLLRKAREFYFGGKLAPYHAQISLTNRCNLACEFCSCGERDNGQELSFMDACGIMNDLAGLGCKGLTITGGGEPLMHPDFEGFVDYVHLLDIRMGLVTNGLLLQDIDSLQLGKLTWCRVSASDDRDIRALLAAIIPTAARANGVDWAFSYVVTRDFNPDKLEQVIRAGMDMDMTHIRVVSDLMDLDAVPDMYDVQQYMVEAGVDVSRTMFQGRKRYTRGAKRCLISLVKPVIGTDGRMYPCCGVQYAMEDMGKDFDKRMAMNGDIDSVYAKQASFDGSACARCYYGQYNDLLARIVDPLEHEEFI